MPMIIRPAQVSDLSAIIALLNPYIENTAITFDTQTYTTETRLPWFNQFSLTGRYQCLVAEQDQSVVAYANSAPLKEKAAYETSVEVSIYSNGPKGVGSALYNELFSRLTNEDVHRAHALITLPNDASIALHQKFGFREVGVLNEAGRKFGQYYSVCWLEKALR